MHAVKDLATRWLTIADRVGWGVEGPAHAQTVRDAVQELADTGASTIDLAFISARPLGSRPVDALAQSADLLCEAAGAAGERRDELLSAARGWLQIAEA